MKSIFDKKFDASTILIVNDVNEALNELLTFYSPHNTRIIKNEEKDDFLLLQATQAIKEAYISSNENKYIFLCGNSFRMEAQNSLLKVLEEPPKNVIFIILTNSKSSLLSTIYSRIPFLYLKTSLIQKEISLNVSKLDLKDIYLFLKENQRISKKEAKNLIESILIKVNKENLNLSKRQLELFSKSSKLLQLNSKPINILTTLLLSLGNYQNK